MPTITNAQHCNSEINNLIQDPNSYLPQLLTQDRIRSFSNSFINCIKKGEISAEKAIQSTYQYMLFTENKKVGHDEFTQTFCRLLIGYTRQIRGILKISQIEHVDYQLNSHQKVDIFSLIGKLMKLINTPIAEITADQNHVRILINDLAHLINKLETKKVIPSFSSGYLIPEEEFRKFAANLAHSVSVRFIHNLEEKGASGLRCILVQNLADGKAKDTVELHASTNCPMALSPVTTANTTLINSLLGVTTILPTIIAPIITVTEGLARLANDTHTTPSIGFGNSTRGFAESDNETQRFPWTIAGGIALGSLAVLTGLTAAIIAFVRKLNQKQQTQADKSVMYTKSGNTEEAKIIDLFNREDVSELLERQPSSNQQARPLPPIPPQEAINDNKVTDTSPPIYDVPKSPKLVITNTNQSNSNTFFRNSSSDESNTSGSSALDPSETRPLIVP